MRTIARTPVGIRLQVLSPGVPLGQPGMTASALLPTLTNSSIEEVLDEVEVEGEDEVEAVAAFSGAEAEAEDEEVSEGLVLPVGHPVVAATILMDLETSRWSRWSRWSRFRCMPFVLCFCCRRIIRAQTDKY